MAERPSTQQNPFYIQVTPQKIDYTMKQTGEKKSHPLEFITLPPGTVLFRGVKIPNPEANEDIRYFYRDFLGDPEGSDHVCLKPTHNVFFYPFPYVAFGADTIGSTFHSMQAVVLVQPMTVVCNISPAKMVRSDAYGFTNTDFPYRRCDTFNLQCHEPSEKEFASLRYDNCLDPTFQQKTGVRGWMAIADRDSIRPNKMDANLLKEIRKKGLKPTAKDSSMGKYILNLEKRQPGLGAQALSWMYFVVREERDADGNPIDEKKWRKQAGFPELALYPYKVHPGEKLIKRVCKTQTHALNLMEREAALNNLNYLPLAAFTKDATVDMVNGHFSYECLGVSKNTFAIPAVDQQSGIETRMREWMDHCQTNGITLPFYGNGKLSFDTRTGFYIFSQMVPKNLRIKLPEKDQRGNPDVPYTFLTLPLDTEEAKRRVMSYMLMFRTFNPGKYLTNFGLEKRFGLYRAMVLNRPPTLDWIFKELEIKMPDSYKSILGRAAQLYKDETGAKTRKELEAEAEKVRKLAMAIQEIPAMHGEQIFYKIYKEAGELAAQYTYDQWKQLSDEKYLQILDLAGRKPTVAEKMEKQYKLKQNVTLTPEARGPPVSPSTANAQALANAVEIPSDVIGKRDYLFGAQIAAKNLKYIQMDETAMYSVTDGKTAMQQTDIIKKKLDELFRMEYASFSCYITDGTANVGGNTISFGRNFMQVNAVEIAPLRASLLANNISVAGTQLQTTVHVADYTKIWDKLQQNVIFMDPPWGGTNYKSKTSLDLFLGPTNVIDLITEMVTSKGANLIAMKAPVNYNIEALKDKMYSIGVNDLQVVKMNKQILILITVPNADIKPLGLATQVTPPYGGLGGTTPPLYGAAGATTPPYGGLGGTTPPAAAPAATPPKELPRTDDEKEYYEMVKRMIRNAKDSGRNLPSPPFDPRIPGKRMTELYQMAIDSTSPVAYRNAYTHAGLPGFNELGGGGRRKTRTSKKTKRTKTRKNSSKRSILKDLPFAQAFTRVWGAHARMASSNYQ